MLLSLPKENQEVQTPQEDGDPSSIGSFLKVVDSIQGLNHLLEDISLDKIIEAEEKANQLRHHLAALQEKLTNLQEIKYWLAKADTSGEDRNPQTTPDIGRDPGKNPSLPSASPAPKNLIPFPGAAKFSRAEKKGHPFQIFSSSSEPKAPEANHKHESSGLPSDGLSAADRSLDSKADAATTKNTFDQQLFGDLIKDYGDFTTHTKQAEQEINTSASPAPPRSKARADSIPLREKHGSTYELTPTRFKSEGDLDRKLKTIIRDYGEVDIYSCPTSDNMKKKALIVTLILIIGYFASSFFFSSHQTENAATTFRLQSSVTPEMVKQPQRAGNTDSLDLVRHPLRGTVDQTSPEDPAEPTISSHFQQ